MTPAEKSARLDALLTEAERLEAQRAALLTRIDRLCDEAEWLVAR